MMVMEPEKRGRGRPKKEPEELLIVRSLRLSREHWAKIDAAGMDQLRKLLNRWKPKDG
jgi:hypothetical protein